MKRLCSYLVFLLSAAVLLGCRKEAPVEPVYFELDLCVQDMRPGTKLTVPEETAIDDIVIMVFERNQSGEYVFSYIPEIVAKTSQNHLKLLLTREIPLIKLAIIANAQLTVGGGEVYQGSTKVVASGENLKTAFNDILFECSENNVTSGWTGRTIPMWWQMGEELNIADQRDMIYGSIWLLRAVAKIVISSAASDFTLTEAYLYNCPKSGKVAADYANIERYDLGNRNGPTINAASVPTLLQKHGLLKIDEGAAIYVPEAVAPVAKDGNGAMYPCHPDATCLVVGGRYAGSERTTYYRIDITSLESGSTSHTSTMTTVDYGEILRDYRYDITITEVRSEGTATPYEALGNRADMGGVITPWQSGTTADMIVD